MPGPSGAKGNPRLTKPIKCKVTLTRPGPDDDEVGAGLYAVQLESGGDEPADFGDSDGLINGSTAKFVVGTLEPGKHFQECTGFKIKISVVTGLEEDGQRTVFRKTIGVKQTCAD